MVKDRSRTMRRGGRAMSSARGRGMLRRAAVGLAWLAAAAGPARAEMEHTTLIMPAITIGFLAEYIAADMHFWAQRDIDVKTAFIAGIGSMNAVISGSADFSFSSGASITRAAAHGQRLVTI